jgi:hypothetical protein
VARLDSAATKLALRAAPPVVSAKLELARLVLAATLSVRLTVTVMAAPEKLIWVVAAAGGVVSSNRPKASRSSVSKAEVAST